MLDGSSNFLHRFDGAFVLLLAVLPDTGSEFVACAMATGNCVLSKCDTCVFVLQ